MNAYLDFVELERALSHIVVIVQGVVNLYACVVHSHKLK